MEFPETCSGATPAFRVFMIFTATQSAIRDAARGLVQKQTRPQAEAALGDPGSRTAIAMPMSAISTRNRPAAAGWGLLVRSEETCHVRR
jgi:hypothetical protein